MKEYIKTFKVVHLFCIGLFLFSSCKKDKSGWKEQNLRGEVESFHEKSYAEGEDFQRFLVDEIKSRFNKEGVWISTENIADGNVVNKVIPKYNDGQTIGINYYDSEGDLKEKSRITYLTDSTSESVTVSPNGEVESRILSLYRDELLIEIIYKKFSNGVLTNVTKSFYEYDSKRNYTLIKVVDSDNKTLMVKRWEYLSFDKFGNWTKKLEFNFDNDAPVFSIERDLKYYF